MNMGNVGIYGVCVFETKKIGKCLAFRFHLMFPVDQILMVQAQGLCN